MLCRSKWYGLLRGRCFQIEVWSLRGIYDMNINEYVRGLRDPAFEEKHPLVAPVQCTLGLVQFQARRA